MKYCIDDKILNTFQGKRVAIVGPSPHLIGKNIGVEIDKYDIVCRVNDVHPGAYENDYGKRTDVIFHNCGTRFIDTFGERLKNNSSVAHQLKCVICPCVKALGSDNDWPSWDENRISNVVGNFAKINDFNIPFYWIGIKNYKEIFNAIGSEPNAGQTALYLILAHNPKELLITGYSFYAQGDYPAQSHRPGHTGKGLEEERIGNSGHPQMKQIISFKNRILGQYKEKVKIDSYLNELLGYDHQNLLELESE
jgi:hypothetical protein